MNRRDVRSRSVITAAVEPHLQLPSKRKAIISYQWRSPGGRWEGPVKLVPEFSIEELRSMPGFSVPRYSPPNFVPLAWSDADEGVVKLLRVPVPE